jgi:hypothetical protein
MPAFSHGPAGVPVHRRGAEALVAAAFAATPAAARNMTNHVDYWRDSR